LFDQWNCPFRHVKKIIRQIELFQDLYCTEEKKCRALKILDNALFITLIGQEFLKRVKKLTAAGVYLPGGHQPNIPIITFSHGALYPCSAQ
jgi:hypothetical protein